ncbi:MAG TPA: APC family permease [Candidatus Aquilonibacter sp.]|nr:APC family permease [Candidatus Aquilonibacter sp.]
MSEPKPGRSGLLRSIGRWAMTGLVINCIIGSGIFGLPGELNRLVQRASPIAMIVAGILMASIMAPAAEVASQFCEAGGAYLYARRAFGRFVGLQIGWFSLLSAVAAAATIANLFVVYLSGDFPATGQGWPRALVLLAFVGVPAAINYLGVSKGAVLSSVLVVAKILPLAVIIVLGLARFSTRLEVIHFGEITAPGWGNWLSALLLLMFAYQGFEYAIIPGGEVDNPRRTMPFSLGAGLLLVVVIYTLLQFVTVATIGTSTSMRPVADTASALIGPMGGILTTIAVLISTGGANSSLMLDSPRLIFSLAAEREFPGVFASVHPRFHTPGIAIISYAVLVWLLAISGGFFWLLAISAAASMVMYISICAALIQLRRVQPHAEALRVPFGPALSLIGIVISLVLIAQLHLDQALLMLVTVLLAAANWWLARAGQPGRRMEETSPSA